MVKIHWLSPPHKIVLLRNLIGHQHFTTVSAMSDVTDQHQKAPSATGNKLIY